MEQDTKEVVDAEVVEEAEVVTRPLATTSVISGSCISITSPGFKKLNNM